MTARERTQFFADFMAKVMDAPTAKYPTSPEASKFTGTTFIQYIYYYYNIPWYLLLKCAIFLSLNCKQH